MVRYVLEERVLTDNILMIADEGKVFKGGYLAIVQEYEFATTWTGKPLEPKRFKSQKRLFDYIGKAYPEFDLNSIEC